MMYGTLAQFYDALVKDEEATQAWVALIEEYVNGKEVLELACGSGEITIALAKDGYHVTGTDISAEMLQAAKKKKDHDLVDGKVMDMCDFQVDVSYDGILCLCDSFNYLLKKEQVQKLFTQVKSHLTKDGVFIMDMHSMDRLLEFAEEYNEAGRIDHHEYQWTIQTIEDCIYQNFAFYDEAGRVSLEQHIQRVYDPMWVKEQLEALDFDVKIITDFTFDGIQEGEKLFYICRKKS